MTTTPKTTRSGSPGGGGELARNRPVAIEELTWRADWIRAETIRLIGQAGLGHYSSTFSCAEIFATLYYHSLRIDPSNPSWTDRDRFLLGKGHVAVGLWPVLADLGYFPRGWLDRYGSTDSPITDHPDMTKVPGIDFSSGSLGHNLSVGVGIALAARVQATDNRVFVLTGDGELQEGQIWEAAMAASHYRLGNLVAILDANGFSGGAATSVTMNIEPLAGRFESFGWSVHEIDGHDVESLVATFDALGPTEGDQPTCIVARTIKGKGVAEMEAAPQAWHLGLLTGEAGAKALSEIEMRMGR